MRLFSLIKVIFSIVLTAAIAATLFLYFSPIEDFGGVIPVGSGTEKLSKNYDALPTLLPNDQSRIGLVAGHWGIDSGHLCPPELNNLREVDVNLRIATLVRDELISRGYQVDLMQEFDPKLMGYTGLALVAIHADTCEYINGQSSGFKVTNIGTVTYPVEAKNLSNCMIERYQKRTKLNFMGSIVSSDPEQYYDYSEVNDYTTSVLVETGYLNLDYRTLTEKTDQVANGIIDGIICYITNEIASGAVSNQQRVENVIPTAEAPIRFILPGVPGLTP